MKTLKIYPLLLLLFAMSISSCKKWLDVQPQDKFTETQVFNTRSGVYQALNGIYLSIGKSAMYGGVMTMFLPDVLAQNYNISAQHNYIAYSTYKYTDGGVLLTLDGLWSSTYAAVANANTFVQNLDKYKGVVPADQDSILRGEAIALRAFLQFDMLRLFGPMYNSADSTLPAIPYYSVTSTTFNAYLPANNVMDSISKDLSIAEGLLSNDPIITYGIAGNPSINTDPFFKNRNYRLNYYAVKALQARVYMYRGYKAAAYAAAQTVIQNADNKFPWIVPSAVLSNKDNPDRTFSTELIFGLQSLDLYNNYNMYYSPGLTDQMILAPLDGRLNTFMESATYPNDLRLNPDWIYPAATSKTYRTFYKFADVSTATMPFRYMLPMLRKSEMYYIAAECAPDLTTAFTYLNTVRYNRGISNLPGTAVLATELKKEYQKEFYGEGQLFYYYKRTNTATIPNGAATSGNITMNKTTYVLPLPQSETNYH